MSLDKAQTLALSSRYQCPHRVRFWQESGIPLVVGKRRGYELWDLDGHRLIDLHLNGGTFNLGHRNPEVIRAMVEAAGEVDIGNHHFPSVARAELAETLARLTPGELVYSVFASGGSEAIDIAIKAARHATGRRKIVTLDAGYHGRTGLSGAAGNDGPARVFLSDRPDEFVKVPFNDLDAMAAALADGDVGAVLLETIPATYGFPTPDPDYLPGVQALCRDRGALYIADEVQAGLGRTGDLWAAETFGVEPDILVTAKGLSGGVYPIAAVVMTREAGAWVEEYGWGHVSTFGGSEIGCRVASRVLEITTRDETRANVRKVSGHLDKGLAEIRSREPYFSGIRKSGLVMGLEFDHQNGAVYVQRELYSRGVWAIAAGYDMSVLQFKPGLLMTEELCDETLDRLEQAIRAAKEQSYDVPRRHKG